MLAGPHPRSLRAATPRRAQAAGAADPAPGLHSSTSRRELSFADVSPVHPATLKFLRALKKNNDREWFKARKDDYERTCGRRCSRSSGSWRRTSRSIAPELEASPKVSLYRIYRDTRFSEDKTPLKTNVAAVFPWKGLARHSGRGAVLRGVAGLGVDRRRALFAGDARPRQSPRAHHRHVAGDQEGHDEQGVRDARRASCMAIG